MLELVSQETFNETIGLYDLKEWLEYVKQTRGGNAKVGTTRQSDSCPLATFVLEKFPVINNSLYRVEVDLFTISIFDKAKVDSEDEDHTTNNDGEVDVKDNTGSVFIYTPEWAKSFIKSVDMLPDIRNLYQNINTGEIITFSVLDSKSNYEHDDWATMELITVTADDAIEIVERIINNESNSATTK